MKNLRVISLFILLVQPLKAQQAMDFNMSDCSGNMHHLYTDYLDSEEVVIIEFFMVCSSCIEVGQAITPMYNQLALDYPGMINFFAFNFNDDFDCSVATNFVTTNGINAVPFDSGAAQLAYYGGFGMPTVAIVGGSQHQLLYFSKTPEGTSDTAAMDSSIRNFFTTLDDGSIENLGQIEVYPNPATGFITLGLPEKLNENLGITIMDGLGRSLFRQSIFSSKQILDIQGLVPGLYYIHISGENLFQSKQIIVQ